MRGQENGGGQRHKCRSLFLRPCPAQHPATHPSSIRPTDYSPPPPRSAHPCTRCYSASSVLFYTVLASRPAHTASYNLPCSTSSWSPCSTLSWSPCPPPHVMPCPPPSHRPISAAQSLQQHGQAAYFLKMNFRVLTSNPGGALALRHIIEVCLCVGVGNGTTAHH